MYVLTQMRQFSSVFILATILLACVAPYHTKRSRQHHPDASVQHVGPGPDLQDVHEVMGLSKTFQEYGLDRFGRCCCDKKSRHDKAFARFHRASRVFQGFAFRTGYFEDEDERKDEAEGVERSGRCGVFKQVIKCGEVSFGSGDASWATGKMHHYKSVGNGKCELAEFDTEPIMQYYHELDNPPDPPHLEDVHEAMEWSHTFKEKGLDLFGRCCCDKPEDDREDQFKSLARSGRCGVFKQASTCVGIPVGSGDAYWAKAKMHHYEKVGNGKCELVPSETELIMQYYFDLENPPDLHNLHTALQRSDAFQTEGLAAFGQCCCDKTKTFAHNPPSRSGRCGVFNVTECGDVPVQNVPWATSKMSVYTDTHDGRCELAEPDLAPLLKHFYGNQYCTAQYRGRADDPEVPSVRAAAFGEIVDVACHFFYTPEVVHAKCDVTGKFFPVPKCTPSFCRGLTRTNPHDAVVKSTAFNDTADVECLPEFNRVRPSVTCSDGRRFTPEPLCEAKSTE